MHQPDDISDFDVIISPNDDVVQVENIEPISKYPGFVRVSINNDEFETSKEFAKASTLNEKFPEKIQNILKAIPLFCSKHLKLEMALEYKRICMAHKTEILSDLPPLEIQLQKAN